MRDSFVPGDYKGVKLIGLGVWDMLWYEKFKGSLRGNLVEALLDALVATLHEP